MNRSMQGDMNYKAGLEDNFLKHIGYEYTELLCDELDKKKDEWESIEVPESLDQWFTDFLIQEKKRRKKENRRSNALKHAKRAAIFILLIVGVNYILVTNVDAYRLQWLNTIMRIQEKFTQIDIVDEKHGEGAIIPEDWEGKYYPTYVPEGYELADQFFNGNSSVLIYTDSTDQNIVFNQTNQKSAVRIDSESGKVSNIIINGELEAIVLEKGDVITISWIKEDIALQINSINIELKEMIRIAESMILKK